DQLVPIVYKELRRLAHYHLEREADGHTLQSTALVHEVYLRLCAQHEPRWENRAHFFAVAARMMRRILVDQARRRLAGKRGGKMPRLNLDDVPDLSSKRDSELVALDEGMNTLAEIDPRKARVIELRFFGGLSVEETAEVLKISPHTVRRDWKLARAWLLAGLGGKNQHGFTA
ncbi:MAG TPA: sigma-70 family RNA polymerase sigma factor, partial [Terriglobia bacterium]|nr:sigma-70 family RNA polymerase sigma factor [Terriglobia bacterium]